MAPAVDVAAPVGVGRGDVTRCGRGAAAAAAAARGDVAGEKRTANWVFMSTVEGHQRMPLERPPALGQATLVVGAPPSLLNTALEADLGLLNSPDRADYRALRWRIRLHMS